MSTTVLETPVPMPVDPPEPTPAATASPTQGGWLRVLRQAATIALIGCATGICYNVFYVHGIYAPVTATEPEKITLEAAKHAFDAGAVFVDARFAWDYAEAHVPGARNVPVGRFEDADAVLGDLSLHTHLIVYCSGAECQTSQSLARKLTEELGFRRVEVMEAGWPGWASAGYAVATGEAR